MANLTKQIEEITIEQINLVDGDGNKFHYPTMVSVIESTQMNDTYGGNGIFFSTDEEESVAEYLTKEGYLRKVPQHGGGAYYAVIDNDGLDKFLEQIVTIAEGD